MHLSRAVLAMLVFTGVALAQTFDAASVRSNSSEARESSIVGSTDRITITNTSLRDCIAFAFEIRSGRDYQLVGPGWMDSEKFDIVATFPPDARPVVRQMLQRLLVDRFHLKTHYETRQIDSYALVKAKKPVALTKSEVEEGAFIYSADHVTFRKSSMAGLADRLSESVFKLDRPVVDQTGIEGGYDFTLQWAPEGVPIDGQDSPSIFTALEEQLGVRLEPRKMPFRILVIDSADRVPSAN